MPTDPSRASALERGASLARYVLDSTGGGKRLADVALEVIEDESAAPRDRLAAVAWLADRALGRAVETSVQLQARLDSGASVDLDPALLERALRALARPAPQPVNVAPIAPTSLPRKA